MKVEVPGVGHCLLWQRTGGEPFFALLIQEGGRWWGGGLKLYDYIVYIQDIISLGKLHTFIKATIHAVVNQVFAKQSQNLKQSICN